MKAHAHHSVAGFHPDFNRQLAEAGLLYPHWPEEFGGQDRTPFEMAALAEVFEEFNWERMTAPITNQVAQIVMRFGTEAVKREVLSKFATGSSLACLGFSEPDAGSDVFAAKTRAVRDGDDWLINGQKIFTTAANLADYVFLLVRTNPDVAKHAGLSLFLVPLGLPGVEIQAVHTLQDERTNITYYADVRVPDRYRIGEVDGGLAVMAATLELEHGGNQYRLSYANMFKHIVHWAQETRRDGRPLIEYPDVRLRLARVAVHTGVAECLCHRAIWGVSHRVPGLRRLRADVEAVQHRVLPARRLRPDGSGRPGLAVPRPGGARPCRDRLPPVHRHDDLRRHQRDPPQPDRRTGARHAPFAKLRVGVVPLPSREREILPPLTLN